jgi:hypothetical protein
VEALRLQLDRTAADRAAPLDPRARKEVAHANLLIDRLAEHRRRRRLAEQLGIYSADDEGGDDDGTRTAPAGAATSARSLLPQTFGSSSAGRTIRNAADYLARLMRGEAPPDPSFAALLDERPGLESLLVHCGVPRAQLRELADSYGNPQALLPWDEVQRQLGIGPHSRVEQMLQYVLRGAVSVTIELLRALASCPHRRAALARVILQQPPLSVASRAPLRPSFPRPPARAPVAADAAPTASGLHRPSLCDKTQNLAATRVPPC